MTAITLESRVALVWKHYPDYMTPEQQEYLEARANVMPADLAEAIDLLLSSFFTLEPNEELDFAQFPDCRVPQTTEEKLGFLEGVLEEALQELIWQEECKKEEAERRISAAEIKVFGAKQEGSHHERLERLEETLAGIIAGK